MRLRRQEKGFSVLEFAVVAVVVSILFAVMLSRVAYYRQQADDLVFKATLLNMRTGLKVEAARLMMKGDREAILNLADTNPIRFLAAAPANYGGELDDNIGKELPRSYWYYSTKRKKLVYLLNSGNSVAIGGQKSLNFKVKLLRLAQDSVGPASVAVNYSVVLAEVEE